MRFILSIIFLLHLCIRADCSDVIESLPEMVMRADSIIFAKPEKVIKRRIPSVDGRESIQVTTVTWMPIEILKGSFVESKPLEIEFFLSSSEFNKQGNYIRVEEGQEYLLFLQLRAEQLLPMLPSSVFKAKSELSFYTDEPVNNMSVPRLFEKRELKDYVRSIHRKHLRDELKR